MSRLKIETLTVGQLKSNCYLVYKEGSDQCIIIDPGDNPEFIQNRLRDLNLTPTQIIATHGHFDHIMAALVLQTNYKIPFLVGIKDEFLVKRLRETSLHFLGTDPGPPPIINEYLKIGHSLEIENWKLKIISSPGHTPGSVSLYNKKGNLIFVGDVIFDRGGVGRTDLSYSNKSDLNKSIQKLLKLPKNTLVYPGHGPSFSISDFKIIMLI